MAIKAVHYVNQFFAGIGGEEKADTKPHVAETLPPISVQLNSKLGEDIEVQLFVVIVTSVKIWMKQVQKYLN